MGGHLAKLASSLDAAVGAYNGAVGSLESRVMVSARRLADLGVVDPGGGDAGLPGPRLVSASTRPLTAPELLDGTDGTLPRLVPPAGETA
jgi:DNA recombination protein RmuC